MSHPLLRVVCFYAAGVLLGYFGQLRLAWLLPVVLGVVAFGLFFARLRPLLFPTLFVFAGWLNLTAHTTMWSDRDVQKLVTNAPVLADVRGHLVETPRISISIRDGESYARTLANMQVTALKTNRGPWMPATGKIAISSSDTLSDDYYQGRAIEVSGVLDRPPGPLAAGLFDYAAYLRIRGIEFQLRAGGPEDWRLQENGGAPEPPFTDTFLAWARQTLSRGLPEDDPATGLLQAMTLGWKTALTDEIEEPFMKSGTMHIFAISGLHIALVAGILLAILRVLRLPRGACGLVLIPALWFYTAATGWQASAVRATLMMTIIIGGWSLKRPSNLINSLAAAALVILLVEPRQLFHASFQLSFGVVLSLAMILPPLQQRLLLSLQPDPLLPGKLIPRWKLWLSTPLRWILMTAAMSFAAWVGSMPLTAHYFHLFSPGTLLANLLLVPCASAALASALASLFCGAWWPWLSEVFNHGAWFWMHCMMTISNSVSSLPVAYRYVASPSLLILLSYYGVLLTLAFGWLNTRWQRVFIVSAALLIGGLLFWEGYQRNHEASFTVLPLRGGMAVHARHPEVNGTVLVDCGNTDSFDSVLSPFLHAMGENWIEALALTHGDVKHTGATPWVVETFDPEQIGISPVRFRSTVYRRIADQLLTEKAVIQRLESGNEFEGWTVLHPPAEFKASKADDGVLVLKSAIHGTKILLLSDLSREGQRQLMEAWSAEELRAEIVVTGLPGEGEPLIADLLQRVQPELIIVADSERPVSRHAPDELLARLRQEGRRVFSTSEIGAVKLRFDAKAWEATDPGGKILLRSRTSEFAHQPPTR